MHGRVRSFFSKKNHDVPDSQRHKRFKSLASIASNFKTNLHHIIDRAYVMLACNFKTFVINLDSSKARWQTCQQQLENVPIERISAVDGRQLNNDELNRHFNIQLNQRQYHKTLTAGEIACYMSHRKVWAKIVEENLDFALVLEDDFLLTGDLHELLSSVAAIAQPWHCIKLTEYPIKRKELSSKPLGKFHLVSYNKVPARTGAQLISQAGAKRLLLASEKFGRPVDIDLQYWWEHNLIVIGLKPYIFAVNHSSGSDIEAIFQRKKTQTRHLSKLYQQLYFYLGNQRAIKQEPF